MGSRYPQQIALHFKYFNTVILPPIYLIILPGCREMLLAHLHPFCPTIIVCMLKTTNTPNFNLTNETRTNVSLIWPSGEHPPRASPYPWFPLGLRLRGSFASWRDVFQMWPLWQAILTYSDLVISRNELEISTIQLLISSIHLVISPIHLVISPIEL